MKKALNAWTVDGNTGFEDMFKQLKEAGFDGIELNVDEVGHSAHSLTLETSGEELAKIKALSERFALPVVSISTSMLGGYRMGAPDEADREYAKQIIRAQLKYAKALGATGILIVPGGVPQQKSFIRAYELSMQTLAELKPEIEAAQINTGVENVWNGFFMSPFDMVSFIDKADSPYICATMISVMWWLSPGPSTGLKYWGNVSAISMLKTSNGAGPLLAGLIPAVPLWIYWKVTLIGMQWYLRFRQPVLTDI